MKSFLVASRSFPKPNSLFKTFFYSTTASSQETVSVESLEKASRELHSKLLDLFGNFYDHSERLSSSKYKPELSDDEKTQEQELLSRCHSNVKRFKETMNWARIDELIRFLPSSNEKSQFDTTLLGKIFAQTFLVQIFEEKNSKLKYTELVLDRILQRDDVLSNEEFLFAMCQEFRDLHLYDFCIKILKILKRIKLHSVPQTEQEQNKMDDYSIILYQLAEMYQYKNFDSMAISELESIIKKKGEENTFKLVFYRLAKSYEKLEQFDKAAHYCELFAKPILEKNYNKVFENVKLPGNEIRGVYERDHVDILLDLAYLYTMANQFEKSSAIFERAFQLFPSHYLILYQWVIACRKQQKVIQKEKETIKPIFDKTKILEESIVKIKNAVKESDDKPFMASVVNKVLKNLVEFHLAILQQAPIKEVWKFIVNASNDCWSRENRELLIYEATNFLFEKREEMWKQMEQKEGDEKVKSPLATFITFILQYISMQAHHDQTQEIYINNFGLWQKIRKLQNRNSLENTDAIRELLITLKIEKLSKEKGRPITLYRKYHCITESEKEQECIESVLNFEQMIQRSAENKISVEKCIAQPYSLEEEEEIYPGIYNVGPLLEKI